MFHWSGARWRFVELINTGRGNNFLDTASEVADRIIAKVGDRGFFDKYGWPASSTEEVREREVARQAKTFAGARKFDQYGKPINRALPQDTVATPVPAPRYRNPPNR